MYVFAPGDVLDELIKGCEVHARGAAPVAHEHHGREPDGGNVNTLTTQATHTQHSEQVNISHAKSNSLLIY